MNRRQTTGGIILLVLLFPLLVLLLIPSSQIQGLVERAVAQQGYTMTTGSFGTAFPLGVRGRDVVIADGRGALLKVDRITLRPAFLPLFTGVVAVIADVTLGPGNLTATWRSGKTGGISADIAGLRLEDIPFFKTVAGATVKGILRGEVRLTGLAPRLNGHIKLELKGAELSDLKIGEMPLPSASYDTVQGMLRVKEGRGRLESLTLEGSGLYARLSGEIPLSPDAPLNLALELMPKAELMEKQKFVFLILTKYLDSPGHYRVPIGGTLGKPSVF